ncbi:hypothetical protein Tco_1361572 [Tanacetum coccineum]
MLILREQLGEGSITSLGLTIISSSSLSDSHSSMMGSLILYSSFKKAGFGHDGAKESKVSETITSVSKVKTDDEIVVKPKEVTKTVKPIFEKIESVNARNETIRQAENPRKNNKSPRGSKRNWNGLVSLNTAKSVSTAQSRKTMNDVMPTTYSYYKAYSSVKRPFNKKRANYNRYFSKRVNTVKSTRVNTARPKAEVNTVKASASWVWKPKHEELDHVFKSNSASKTLTRYDYVDALGRFKSVLAWDFKRH